MHYYGLVLIKPGKNIKEELEILLSPYSENLESIPRQEFLEEDDIERMEKHYNLYTLEELADKIEDWHGSRGGYTIDGRLFYWTTYNQDAHWDGWMIGGRWKGKLDPSYEQDKDQFNYNGTCSICNGTGMRPGWGVIENGVKVYFAGEWKAQAEHCNGCNACHGTGNEMKWPTQWEQHPSDTSLKASDVLALIEKDEKMIPYNLVTPYGEWLEKEGYGEDELNRDWKEKVIKVLTMFKDCTVVVVDYHI